MTNAVQTALLEVLNRGDASTYVAMLARTPLLLPVDRSGRPVATALDDGRRAVEIFTAIDALRGRLGDTPSVCPVTICDLASRWPDPAWLLVVDPGQPTAAHLSGRDLREVLDDLFEPENDAEAAMAAAGPTGDRRAMVLALVGTELYVPVRPGAGESRDLTDPAFAWWTERLWSTAPGLGEVAVPIFTSQRRMLERLVLSNAQPQAADAPFGPGQPRLAVPSAAAPQASPAVPSAAAPQASPAVPSAAAPQASPAEDFVVVDLHPLISAWPDPSWAMAVNPGTPMAVTLSAAELRAVAAVLDEVGTEPWRFLEPEPPWWAEPPAAEIELQVAVPPSALTHYLDGAYDRVAGVVHLRPAGRQVDLASFYLHLGLARPQSRFALTDDTVHIVRWRSVGEQAQEWRANPTPRLASTTLPAGASLLRLARDGAERMLARFDGSRWVVVSG